MIGWFASVYTKLAKLALLPSKPSIIFDVSCSIPFSIYYTHLDFFFFTLYLSWFFWKFINQTYTDINLYISSSKNGLNHPCSWNHLYFKSNIAKGSYKIQKCYVFQHLGPFLKMYIFEAVTFFLTFYLCNQISFLSGILRLMFLLKLFFFSLKKTLLFFAKLPP